MRPVKSFLIVTDRGECRVVKRTPTLARDEYAFPLNITIPNAPSRMGEAIEVSLPVPPEEVPAIDVDDGFGPPPEPEIDEE